MRLLFFVLLAASAAAQTGGDTSPHSEARLVTNAAAVAPGDAAEVALVVDVEPGWHIYWKNSGDSGQPTRVGWRLPDGASAGPLRYPSPALYAEAGIATYAHSGSPAFLTLITIPEDAQGAVQIGGLAEYLICSDICLQASEEVALTVPVGAATETTDVLDGALAALPTDGAGWSASVSSAGASYTLTVRPPGGVSMEDAMFFPSEKGVLDHSSPQTFTEAGGAWSVDLAGSAYASAPADTLSGVLVAGGQAVSLGAPVTTAESVATLGGAAGGTTFWGALGLAFFGGVLLNLMPCVFPILSIKVMGFVQDRDASASTLRAHGLAFGAGVVASFLALAAILLALMATTEGAGWGFQLKYPAVVAGLALLMTGLALNLLGVFEVGGRVASVGGRLDQGEGLNGAFLSGVLATVVASPCTAPFMGAALGFAVTQSAPVALTVFAALGVGMALPYVALSFRPSWLQKLPRPGAWMVTLKQVLAFPLLMTAVWLVWVFGALRGLDAAAVLLLALVVGGLAAWAWGRWPRHGTASRPFAVARTSSVVVAALGVWLVAVSLRPAESAWRDFDSAEVESLVASGEPVFIDFTASWCLSCQANKHVALDTDAVRDGFDRAGVTTVRADWTRQDPDITVWLDRFGRSGVPLYVFYPGDGAEPVVLPTALTPGIVLDAIESPARTASR